MPTILIFPLGRTLRSKVVGPSENRDALGGTRTRTGLPPEDFTYHYRFRGLHCEALHLCKAVRGLDCLFAVPRVPKEYGKTVRFDKFAFAQTG